MTWSEHRHPQHRSSWGRTLVGLVLAVSAVSAVTGSAGLVSARGASAAPATAAAPAAAAAPRSATRATATFSAVKNPARNSRPVPDYNNPCWAGGAKGAADTAACHTQALAAVNHQHALEHVKPITLPRNYWSLAPALQIFVITNLERTSRGLKPAVGTTAQMNGWAAVAAKRNVDPALASWNLSGGTELQTYGSVWASDLGPLDADFLWMYSDGWVAGSTSNIDCTSARSAGCWGHRQIILGRYAGSAALVAGVGSIPHHNAKGLLNSDAAAFANYTGSKPKLAYTWAQATAEGAR